MPTVSDIIGFLEVQDFDAICSNQLPSSEELSEDKLNKLARASYNLWIALLGGHVVVRGEGIRYTCQRCPNVHVVRGSEAVNRLLMVLGDHYCRCVATHIASISSGAMASRDVLDFPGVSLDELRALREGTGSSEGEWTRELLNHFVGAAQMALLIRALRSINAGSTASQGEDEFLAILARSTLDIFHVLDAATTPEGDFKHGMDGRFLARTVLSRALHLQLSILLIAREPWSASHVAGPFSALRLGQLDLLAQRDPGLAGRLSGSVEKEFEQQLALLVQSLGFYVIATRTGDRTVDLVCISSDPKQAFTFILEAKTTSGPYKLPVADERAIVEYAQQVSSRLTTLPRLEFVLVVGASPGPTMEKRLARTERAAGVPIRFLRASSLAYFREALLGPLPLDVFRTVIVSGNRVLTNDDMTQVVQTASIRSQAHEDLVRALLGSG